MVVVAVFYCRTFTLDAATSQGPASTATEAEFRAGYGVDEITIILLSALVAVLLVVVAVVVHVASALIKSLVVIQVEFNEEYYYYMHNN